MQETLWSLRPNTSDREARDPPRNTYDLPASEALEAIVSGRACFAKAPSEPPWGLLDVLERRLASSLDILGPPLIEKRLLTRIQKELFPVGVRQTLADGNVIHWQSGRTGLRWLIGDKFSNCPAKVSNLFAEARWIVRGHGQGVHAGLGRQGRYENDFGTSRTFPFSALEPLILPADPMRLANDEWTEFEEMTHRVLLKFEDVLDRAMKEFRIISGYETSAGVSFVAPKILASMQEHELGASYHFALSCDLPVKWVAGSLDALKAIAAAWLGRAGAHFDGEGRRFSQATARAALNNKFGLSQNASEDAVRSSKLPKAWSGGGNFREVEKVGVNELLAFD